MTQQLHISVPRETLAQGRIYKDVYYSIVFNWEVENIPDSYQLRNKLY